MKRIIALLLVVVAVFSLSACGGSGNGETTESTEAGPVKTDVAKPLSKAELDALPIASPDMTEEQLRQIIVDFMKMQNSFAWTPSKKIGFVGNKNGSYVVLAPGKVYGGCPYVGLKQGNLYNAMHFYDDTNGMMNIEKLEENKIDWQDLWGNMCSSSTLWAWARVSNSLRAGSTSSMIPAKGCIPVGNHEIDMVSFSWEAAGQNTTDVTQANGPDVMYESYALMKPADGIIYLDIDQGAGHAIMISGYPVVVRDENGKIDGKKSHVTFIDQALMFKTYEQENGVIKNTFGNVDSTHTFEKLFNIGALPWTLPEFAGLDPVEVGEVTTKSTYGDSVTVNDLRRMKVKANYPISYTTLTVKSPSGEKLFEAHNYTCKLQIMEFDAIVDGYVDRDAVAALANGENIVEVSARIGNGAILTAYSGTLKK